MDYERYFCQDIFINFIQPQHKNFCGICSLIAVVNSLFSLGLTQESINKKYRAGYLTKRKLTSQSNPAYDQLELVDEYGMSNFDIIRLFNTISIDCNNVPFTALLTGESLFSVKTQEIANWFKIKDNHMILHMGSHYMAITGYLHSETGFYWIVADSKRKGDVYPIRTINNNELLNYAKVSDKYGLILLTNEDIEFLQEEKGNPLFFPNESKEKLTIKL